MYKNNFDFLRLLFAVLVIISHSFVLTGNAGGDYISILSGKQMTFSHIGVSGFFSISGYLVMQSLMRSRSIGEYLIKRVLRIYPALVVMLLLTVLLGPLVYTGTISGYLSNPEVWTYIPHNLSLFNLQDSINGIFENNPFPLSINASLHTIPFEVLFYLMLILLFYFKINKQRVFILTGAFCVLFFLRILYAIVFINSLFPSYIIHGINYSGFFLAGALIASFKRENIRNKKGFLAVIAIVWGVSLYFHFYVWIQFLVLPVSVILTGNASTPVINSLGKKIGDLSYGIYIYAFPIQQTLVHFFHPKPIQLMLYGILVTLPFAFLSWHLIEDKALKLKNRFTPVFRNAAP